VAHPGHSASPALKALQEMLATVATPDPKETEDPRARQEIPDPPAFPVQLVSSVPQGQLALPAKQASLEKLATPA